MIQPKTISVYADGSSVGNSTGPIGWGWLVTDWDTIICAGSEGAPVGTNNIAELQGALHGLRAVVDRGLHIGNNVEIVSDSTYCLNLASGLYQANTHKDIVHVLQDLYKVTNARTRWVRGHSGDIFNDRCDELAKAGRDRYSPIETKKKRRSRKREERRRKRAIVKAYKRRVYGHGNR
jgi:ribonuclease HI